MSKVVQGLREFAGEGDGAGDDRQREADWLAAFAIGLIVAGYEDDVCLDEVLEASGGDRDLLAAAAVRLRDLSDEAASHDAAEMLARAVERAGERGADEDHILVLPDQIEVLETLAWQPAAISATHWPCPTCGRRQPVDGASKLRIRNLVGPPLERFVIACGECVATFPRQPTPAG